ncbi:MAG: hypothetical protein MI919_12920, partial [Holophagales bacterium]|nr:hypothetical protein [Holophagales bacterium]
DLVVEDGQLIYRAGSRESSILPSPDRFEIPGSNTQAIAREEKGRVRAFEVERALHTLVYRRGEPPDRRSLDLEDYAGTFRSEELDLSLTLEAEEGFLAVTGDRPDTPLSTRFDPVIRDCFRAPYRNILFRFRRNTAGAVAEMWIDMARVRGLRFVRVQPAPGPQPALR